MREGAVETGLRESRVQVGRVEFMVLVDYSDQAIYSINLRSQEEEAVINIKRRGVLHIGY